MSGTATLGLPEEYGEMLHNKNDGNKPADMDPETMLTDPQRRRCVKTILILTMGFIVGLIYGQEGVTFLDLLLVTNSDIERGSLLLTIGALGQMVGYMVSGFLYDNFNNDIIFTACSVIAGLLTIAIPWYSDLPSMVAILGLRNLFVSSVDCGRLVICSRMWLTQVGPILQATQFVLAVGGIAAPLVTNPFLQHTETGSSWENASEHVNWTFGFTNVENRLEISNESNLEKASPENGSYTYLSDMKNKTDTRSGIRTTHVYAAYLISGCLILTTAIIFTFIIAPSLLCSKTSMTYVKAHRRDRREAYSMNVTILGFSFLGLYCFSYGCVIALWRAYLMAFLVELLGWTKTRGSVGNAVYWGGFAAGRFLCIYVIRVVRPGSLLIFDYSGLIVASAMLVFIFELPEAISWIIIGAVGLFQASMFATVLLWIDQYFVPLTGKVLAYVCTCQFTGSMSHVVLFGYLFEEFTPMWFVYLSVIHATVALFSFAALSVVACNIRR